MSARTILMLALIGLLTACAPAASPTPAATLRPPAMARVTATADLPATGIPSATDVPPALTPIKTRPTLPPTVQQLAEQVYGPRLIRQVRIPAIQVAAPVVAVGWAPSANGEEVDWDAPGAQVGWVVSSALPPDAANIVLYGHNNIDSSVFQHLADLQPGDAIVLVTGEREWRYQVKSFAIFPDITRQQDQEAYARYFQPGAQAALTLISCWPPESNTHRVVVLAEPE